MSDCDNTIFVPAYRGEYFRQGMPYYAGHSYREFYEYFTF